MINESKDIPNPNLIRNLFWGNITREERTKFEQIYSGMMNRREAADEITQVEDKLREIIAHEEYIRTLRQDYENKLRSFKLSKAITTSRRL